MTNQGHVYYFSRRLDLAVQKYRAARADFPHLPNPSKDLGRAYIAQGRFREAIAELERAQFLGSGHSDTGWLGLAFGKAGETSKARARLQSLLAESRSGYVSPLALTLASMGAGDRSAALGWLEKAAQDRCPGLKWITVDPLFDELRAEPRFQAVLRKMGLDKFARAP
jgi:serine/threonine-protein kinase